MFVCVSGVSESREGRELSPSFFHALSPQPLSFVSSWCVCVCVWEGVISHTFAGLCHLHKHTHALQHLRYKTVVPCVTGQLFLWRTLYMSDCCLVLISDFLTSLIGVTCGRTCRHTYAHTHTPCCECCITQIHIQLNTYCCAFKVV